MSEKLTVKEKLFCKFYTSVWEKTFLNWTQSYKKVYPKSNNNTAKNEASVFLAKPYISNYMQELYNEVWLNENTLDRELMKVVLQDEEKWAKVSAIKVWNDLLARVEKAKQKALNNKEITTDVLTIKLPE